MFALAIYALTIGYALIYTAADNLSHGGQGHTLWQNLGITTTLNLGEPKADSGDPGIPNQSGAPPIPDLTPFIPPTVPL